MYHKTALNKLNFENDQIMLTWSNFVDLSVHDSHRVRREELVTAYNSCVRALSGFRSDHIQIVTKYTTRFYLNTHFYLLTFRIANIIAIIIANTSQSLYSSSVKSQRNYLNRYKSVFISGGSRGGGGGRGV